MKTSLFLLLSAWAAAPLSGLAAILPEVGVSYFSLRQTGFDDGSNVLSVDEPREFAPFIAAKYEFTERVGLRLSYHFVNDAETTAQFGSLPGSQLPIVVWGHFEDEIHVLSLAPEFAWNVAPQLTFTIAPQVNWVASRGVVSYTTDNPLVLLVGPRDRNDDGFTLGGSTRLLWSIGPRATLTLGYQYLDLDPSFEREAHVLSGGLSWRF